MGPVQCVGKAAQPRLLAAALACQRSIEVSGRGVGVVAAALTAGVPAIALVVPAFCVPEAFLRSPSLEQAAIGVN